MCCRFSIGSSRNDTYPAAGSQPRLTAKRMISSRPSQKCGTDRPTRASLVEAWSEGFPRRTAAITPARTPSRVPNRIESTASSSVIGSRVTTVCATGSWRDRRPGRPGGEPRPLGVLDGHGLVEPVLVTDVLEHAGSRFSPPSASAGSPGRARTPANTRMLARKMTIRAAPARLSRKPPTIVLCLRSPTWRRRRTEL